MQNETEMVAKAIGSIKETELCVEKLIYQYHFLFGLKLDDRIRPARGSIYRLYSMLRSLVEKIERGTNIDHEFALALEFATAYEKQKGAASDESQVTQP